MPTTLKKLTFSIMLISIFLIPLTSLQLSSPSATDVALSYYTLLFKQDASQIISFNIMDEEMSQTFLNNLDTNLQTQIATELSMENRITPSKEQITSIKQAYLLLLSQLNCTATSKKEDNCYIVTLSSNCIDFNALSKQATTKALGEVNISNYKEHTTYLQDLLNAYVPYLLEVYHNAHPLEATQEAEFIFTKQNGLWLPEDYEAFLSTLCQLIIYTPDKSNLQA